jgi:drug/metabolite transporter superfamily protein YnfA
MGSIGSGDLKLGLARLLFVLLFVAAAVLEVGGDAIIRTGLRGSRPLIVVGGFLVLGSYGVVVNLLPLDFSRLLGVYVGVFAVVSVAAGRLVFGEQIPLTTWVGVAVILAGSAIIQLGGSR